MKELKKYNDNLEEWFLSRIPSNFPDSLSLVSKYEEIVKALRPVHKEVTTGADLTDGTSLTWHDESHRKKVIKQVSRLLLYEEAIGTACEVVGGLVAIQIHDIRNIEGREEHENRAISIFNDLNISGLIDSILLKNIGFVASCHANWMKFKPPKRILRLDVKISYIVKAALLYFRIFSKKWGSNSSRRFVNNKAARRSKPPPRWR